MSNKTYFSYIRVSTQRQGQHGTSLAEQQAAIDRFAQTWDLKITNRFTEMQTAAKRGTRNVYSSMLKQLKQGKAQGVIIHKIDRSARNLKDWAELLSLADAGVEVHFASESLDLTSRGGRLSADIQAVVASDFIRNLREETIKGLYGRLKQGLYPFRAVQGYLDTGPGNPKAIDPVSGPLVRKAFETYSTGEIGLHDLAERLFRAGLKSRTGKKVTINGLSTIFHNPFYIGVIRIKKTGETFRGRHEPLISHELFEKVQDVLAEKNIKKVNRHFFAYRRMIRCRACGNSLIPERRQSYVYYRCHTRTCSRISLTEENLTARYLGCLQSFKLSDVELAFMEREAKREIALMSEEKETSEAHLQLQLEQTTDRLSILADALIDGLIDKETYNLKKEKLVEQEVRIRSSLSSLPKNGEDLGEDFEAFIGMLNSAYLSFKSGTPELRRKLAKLVTLECVAEGKVGLITLKPQFELIANRPSFRVGRAHRETTRKSLSLVNQLLKCLTDVRLTNSDHGLALE